MRQGTCTVCSEHGDVHRHHTARAVVSDLTVPVCPACHRSITNWQARTWQLRTPRPEELALVSGMLRVLEAVTGAVGNPEQQSVVRALSALVESIPTTAQGRRESDPAPVDRARRNPDPDGQTANLGRMIADTADALGWVSPAVVDRVRLMETQPWIDHDPSGSSALLVRLIGETASSAFATGDLTAFLPDLIAALTDFLTRSPEPDA